MSGPAALPNAPRIFVSHSHEDDEYCRTFVDELRRIVEGHLATLARFVEDGRHWQEPTPRLVAWLLPNLCT